MEGAPEGGGEAVKPQGVTQALIDSAFFGPAKQYVRWDTGLHEVFVAAVEELGGAHAAKPAVIRERMGISLLTTAQVKSHLQKYRIRVVAEGKASDAATEAQARAAARLLARQRKPGEGLAQPTRPRGAVPIRGSRQANAAAAAAGGAAPPPAKRTATKSSGGRRKRRKAASSRSAWSEDEDEDPELEAALEAEAEAESGSEPLSAGSDDEAGEEHGSGGEDGRSAGTTSASPRARARGGRRQPAAMGSQQQSDAALQLEQLVERLTGKEGAPDVATVAGLAARRDNLMAAAAAAAAALGPQPPAPAPPQPRKPSAPLPPPQQPQSYIEVKQEAPALAGDLAAGLAAASGSSMLSASTAAAAMQRQAALEQALLEQSMWVQKLAAEVQDLRVRQQLGLPPLQPAEASFASPFAALSQAAFPGGAGPESGNAASGPPQHRASTATVANGGPGGPAANGNNNSLLTCDSALLRLLSTTLGGGSLLPNDPGAAAAVAAATAGLQQSSALPPVSQPLQQQSQQHSQQQQQQQRQRQQQPPQQQQSFAAHQSSLQSLQLPSLPAPSSNLLTCDSTLLRLLSQSLGAALPQPDASSSMAAALLGGIGGLDMQTALAAAAAFAPPAPPLPSNLSPFAALTAQAMGPPSLHGGMPAALQAAAAAAARPGGGGASAGRQSSLEVLNSMLGLSGGTGRAASIPLAAEFLRLCSLPLGADVLPPPPTE